MNDPHERPRAPHREELIYLLSEAAELEHGLMCSYLFAAFSLKKGAHPDLTAAERAKVAEWRASIRAVAIEEMLHLALVQNLLASIGAAPHFQRPNLPVSAGLYPAGVVIQLRRFDEATLDHFVFLERPEGVELPDGEGFEAPAEYVRGSTRPRLTATAQDYRTVGALYQGIETSFVELARSLGEAALFVGDPRAQVGPELLALDGLHAVTDVATATRAIERIIEQGEGGRRAHQTSHYDRFLRIRDEYRALRRARPDFEPAHPVAENPVMNRPVVAEGHSFVDAPATAPVLDVANAAYGLMVQLLARAFGHVDEAQARKALADAAIELMAVAIGPLADHLVTLPASPSLPGQTAGLSFTLPRSTHALPQRAAAWSILHERARQIADACPLPGVAEAIRGVAAKIDRARR